jgi:hypothetical protein
VTFPLYFANPCAHPEVIAAMRSGELGFIDTPRQRNIRPDGVAWCADNGAFGKEYDEAKWWAFLLRNQWRTHSCFFATLPDVVGDAWRTGIRSLPWMERVRQLGYPVAWVAQDGQENQPLPWLGIDCLFVGGSTEWKTSPVSAELMWEAKSLGKWVHVGRVNSYKRLKWSHEHGADSVDGTFLRFAPTENLGRLRRWYEKLEKGESR